MPLGNLEHIFISPDGTDTVTLGPDRIGSFESSEESPGGVMAASGRLEKRYIRDYQGVITRNATWRVRIAGSGETRFGGRLLDPAPNGTIVARGWADVEKKASRRFMPQTRNYGEWTGMDSEPFSAARDGYNVADAISTEVKNGSLRLKLDGSGQDPASGGVNGTTTFRYRNGLIAWFPGVDLQRIAGRMRFDPPFEPGTFQLGIYKARGPDGDMSLIQDGSNPYQLGLNALQLRDFDLRITADADMVAIILENPTTVRQSVQRASSVRITQLRINGIGYDDEYPAGRFVEEVFGRMGLRNVDIDGNATNTLPYDLDDNAPYAEALDYVNLLTGWRHRVVDDGNGRFGEWGPWGPEWQVPEDQFDEYVPLERYDGIRLPFNAVGGRTDEVVVYADDANRDVPLMFDGLTLSGESPTRHVAYDMATRAIEELSRRRLGGEFSLAEVYAPGSDARVSAHLVRAGDVLYYPHYEHLRVKVQSLTRTHSSVSGQAEQRLSSLDRMVARYNRRQHRKGRY